MIQISLVNHRDWELCPPRWISRIDYNSAVEDACQFLDELIGRGHGADNSRIYNWASRLTEMVHDALLEMNTIPEEILTSKCPSTDVRDGMCSLPRIRVHQVKLMTDEELANVNDKASSKKAKEFRTILLHGIVWHVWRLLCLDLGKSMGVHYNDYNLQHLMIWYYENFFLDDMLSVNGEDGNGWKNDLIKISFNKMEGESLLLQMYRISYRMRDYIVMHKDLYLLSSLDFYVLFKPISDKYFLERPMIAGILLKDQWEDDQGNSEKICRRLEKELEEKYGTLGKQFEIRPKIQEFIPWQYGRGVNGITENP